MSVDCVRHDPQGDAAIVGMLIFVLGRCVFMFAIHGGNGTRAGGRSTVLSRPSSHAQTAKALLKYLLRHLISFPQMIMLDVERVK